MSYPSPFLSCMTIDTDTVNISSTSVLILILVLSYLLFSYYNSLQLPDSSRSTMVCSPSTLCSAQMFSLEWKSINRITAEDVLDDHGRMSNRGGEGSQVTKLTNHIAKRQRSYPDNPSPQRNRSNVSL
jgi:hypothetical protein